MQPNACHNCALPGGTRAADPPQHSRRTYTLASTQTHTTGSELLIMSASLAVHHDWCNHRAARCYCCQPHGESHEQYTLSAPAHPSCAPLFQQSSGDWLDSNLRLRVERCTKEDFLIQKADFTHYIQKTLKTLSFNNIVFLIYVQQKKIGTMYREITTYRLIGLSVRLGK